MVVWLHLLVPFAKRMMRAWFSGRTRPCQGRDGSSILPARTRNKAPVVKWISRQASNLLLGVRIPPGAQNDDEDAEHPKKTDFVAAGGIRTAEAVYKTERSEALVAEPRPRNLRSEAT